MWRSPQHSYPPFCFAVVPAFIGLLKPTNSTAATQDTWMRSILEHYWCKVLSHPGSEPAPYLAAILLGTVWAADRRGGNGASQLGVGAQHRVGLSRASRTKFPNAWWEFSSWVVLQNMGFAFAGTLINLQCKQLTMKARYESTFLLKVK